MSLGLHLRVLDPAINNFEQLLRAKIWFSLYKMQMITSEITGRPQLVRSAHVTVPLEILDDPSYGPNTQSFNVINFDPSTQARQVWLGYLEAKFDELEETPTHDEARADLSIMTLPHPPNRFAYCIRLCQISEDVADQLFTGRQNISWRETQKRIEQLQLALDAWSGTLPEELFLGYRWQQGHNPRSRTQLAMYRASVTMILHRSCLCDIQIDDESTRSKEFNVTSARSCVEAALYMLEIMSDDFVTYKTYDQLPWWTLLHYICQAASILVLELCLGSMHFQGEAGQLITAMCKAMSYLAGMSEDSMSAYKAWRIFNDLLRRVCIRYGNPNLFGVLSPPDPPLGWTTTEENALFAAMKF